MHFYILVRRGVKEYTKLVQLVNWKSATWVTDCTGIQNAILSKNLIFPPLKTYRNLII